MTTAPLAHLGISALTLTDQAVHNEFQRKTLSPSMISKLEQCQANAAFTTVVLHKYLSYPDDTPFIRGQLFHLIVERLGLMPAEQRTVTTVRALVDEYASQHDSAYGRLLATPEPMAWLRDAINGMYEMGVHPQSWRLAAFDPPVEVKLNGNLPGTTNRFFGKIDMLLQGQDGLIVVDWKTGKDAHIWRPTDRFPRGFNEIRQQYLYTVMLAQQYDKPVSGAQLWFPVARQIVAAPINDWVFTRKVEDSVKIADETLSTCKATGTFSYTPSALCSWCPLVNACPQAAAPANEKAATARATQYSVSEICERVTCDHIS